MPKNHFFTALMTAGCLLPAGSALAQFNEHYIAGTEGIRPGSLPGPGIYFDDINLYANLYQNGTFGSGVFRTYASERSSTYVNEPRLRWISKLNVLGANYGMEVMIPLSYQNTESFITIPGFPPPTPSQTYAQSQRRFDANDLEVSPLLLAWHLKHFDFSMGYAFWVRDNVSQPGVYGAMPVVNPLTGGLPGPLGQHWWAQMLMAGGTWYPDATRHWAVSALCHYENDQKDNVGSGLTISYGQLFTSEWSLSRTAGKYIEAGVVGNYSQQTTPTGVLFENGFFSESLTPSHSLIELGPEIKAKIPQWDFSASIRYLHQMNNPNNGYGSYNMNLIALTLSKRF